MEDLASNGNVDRSSVNSSSVVKGERECMGSLTPSDRLHSLPEKEETRSSLREKKGWACWWFEESGRCGRVIWDCRARVHL